MITYGLGLYNANVYNDIIFTFFSFCDVKSWECFSVDSVPCITYETGDK